MNCEKKFEIKITSLKPAANKGKVNLAKKLVIDDQKKVNLDDQSVNLPYKVVIDPDKKGQGSLHQPITKDDQSHDQPMTMVDQPMTMVNLDVRTQALIKSLGENKTQKEVADEIKISVAAINKRIKTLVKKGILIQTNSRPRTYSVNKQVTISTKAQASSPVPKKVLTINHQYPVKCDVIGNFDAFEALRQKAGILVEMQNWVKKHFTEGKTQFQLTTRSIIYNVCGAGFSIPEMFTNAKNKAVDIYRNLETKYNLKLNFPEFIVERGKVKTHINLMQPVTNEQLQALTDDASHEGLLETDDPNLAAAKQRSLNDSSPGGRIDQLQASIQKLAESQKQLNDATSALLNSQAQIIQSQAQMMQSQAQILQLLRGIQPQNSSKGPGMDPQFYG